MAAEMPGFMIYREAASILSIIDDADAAQAVKAACNYFLNGKITPLSGSAQIAFDVIRRSIDNGREKYQKQVEAGKRGAVKRYGE